MAAPCAFCVCCCTSQWSGIKNLIYNILLIQSYFGKANIALSYNWPTWFLSSIMLSYLLAPIFNSIVRKITDGVGKYRVYMTMILMAAVFTVQFLWAYRLRAYLTSYDKGYYFVYIFPLARTADFLQGILLAYIVKALEKQCWYEQNATLIESVCCLIFFIEAVVFKDYLVIYRYVILWEIPACLIIGFLALEKGKISNLLANSEPLRYIGGISFELYIIHRMVIVQVSEYSTSILAWVYCSLIILLLAIIAKELRTRLRRCGMPLPIVHEKP